MHSAYSDWHHAMVVVVFDATFGQASLFVHGKDLGLTSGAAFPYGASILAGDYARAGTCGGVPAARVLLLGPVVVPLAPPRPPRSQAGTMNRSSGPSATTSASGVTLTTGGSLNYGHLWGVPAARAPGPSPATRSGTTPWWSSTKPSARRPSS